MTDTSEALIHPCIGRKITWNIYGVQFFGIVVSINRSMSEDNQPEDASFYVKVDKEASPGGSFHGGDNYAAVANPDHLDWWRAHLGAQYDNSAISTSRWLD